jgi:hypothetical protein
MHAKEFLDPVKQKNLEQLEIKAGIRQPDILKEEESQKKEQSEKEKNKKQSKEKEESEREKFFTEDLMKENKKTDNTQHLEHGSQLQNVHTNDIPEGNITETAREDEILEAEDIRRVMEEERLKNPVPSLTEEAPVEKKKKKKKKDGTRCGSHVQDHVGEPREP